MRSLHPYILTMALAPICLPSWAAQATQDQQARLTIAKQAGVSEVSANVVRCELGVVDPVESPVVERVFKLHNSSKETIVVERVQSSCGCTTVSVGESAAAKGIQELAPGGEIPVKVALSVANLHPGFNSKYVWVYTRGDSRAALTVEVSADVRASISFSPRVLEFGRLKAGATKSITLTATIDNRLLKDLPEPQLISANPDVIVPAKPASTQRTTVDGRDVTILTYEVTLSPKARLGYLTGGLSFSPGTLSGTRSAALITGQTAPVSGVVMGKISAAPASIVFGSVTRGAVIAREIVISATDTDALKGLRITPGSPLLTAEFKSAPAASGQSPSTVLVVRLAANKLPVGAFQSQVTIETDDGQRLVLPVIAYTGAQ